MKLYRCYKYILWETFGAVQFGGGNKLFYKVTGTDF